MSDMPRKLSEVELRELRRWNIHPSEAVCRKAADRLEVVEALLGEVAAMHDSVCDKFIPTPGREGDCSECHATVLLHLVKARLRAAVEG